MHGGHRHPQHAGGLQPLPRAGGAAAPTSRSTIMHMFG
jgi:hypothetical protein